MVCVLKSNHFKEVFHRQNFFFINFGYRNNFEVLSTTSDNRININENDCYIGQPFIGYALIGDSDSKKEIIIIGFLIRKHVFFKEYLPSLTSAQRLFQFVLEPENNSLSENSIHVSFPKNHPIKKLIEISVSEYTNKSKNTQAILKALTLSILMYINQQVEIQKAKEIELTLVDRIIQFIESNIKTVTLRAIADEFSYHLNYISNLIRK